MSYDSKAERAMRAVEERFADANETGDPAKDAVPDLSGGLDPHHANDRNGDIDAAEWARKARRGEL